MALSFRWERCHSAVPSYTVDIFAWPESVGNYLSHTVRPQGRCFSCSRITPAEKS